MKQSLALLLTCVSLSGALAPLAGAAPQHSGQRICGSPDFKKLGGGLAFGSQSDCAMTSNTAGTEYDPGSVMEIPVVWHVITSTSGTGDVSDQRIFDQMDHMNDSYAGALSPQGNESAIRFVLASVDPQGNPTTGIERVANNNWFNDQGNYTSLTWDSHRYLNIFTMKPLGGGGVIGYVVNLPQGGIVGSADDAVRMLHSAIDSNTYRHVVSHEIGHHLGLYHTFEGCQNTNCQTQGDLICDTNPHNAPTYQCGSNSGNCGGLPVPGNNFMNYQDVSCVREFSVGQIQRMRCTLENWRPSLYSSPSPIGTSYCTSGPNSTGGAAVISATGSTSVADNDVLLLASPVPDNFGLFYYGTQQSSLPFGNGIRCTTGSPVRLAAHLATGQELGHQLDLNAPNGSAGAIVAGSTLYFQAWFRDPAAGGADFDLSDGLEIVFVP